MGSISIPTLLIGAAVGATIGGVESAQNDNKNMGLDIFGGAVGGAISGGLAGPLGGAVSGSALGGALGATGSTVAGGALAGALGSGIVTPLIEGQKPSLGSVVTGGVLGGAGAGIGQAFGGADGAPVSSDGSTAAGASDLASNVAADDAVGGGSTAAGVNNASAMLDNLGTTGTGAAPAAATGAIGKGLGGISNTSLVLGGLAAAGSVLGGKSKPATYQTPNASSNTAGVYQNMPLTPYTGPTRVAMNPVTGAPISQGSTGMSTGTSGTGVSTGQGVAIDPITGLPIAQTQTSPWYTYGQGPEQTFFTNNDAGSYALAKGGALSDAIRANGGDPKGLYPDATGREFRTSNGKHLVRGPGTGTSDDIRAALSDGEYVLTAREVASLGGGDNDRGAKRLDRARKTGSLTKALARFDGGRR